MQTLALIPPPNNALLANLERRGEERRGEERRGEERRGEERRGEERRGEERRGGEGREGKGRRGEGRGGEGRGGEERRGEERRGVLRPPCNLFANLPKATHTHLFGDNGGKINLVVSIVLEGLSHHRGNKDGGHGQ